MTNPQVFLGHPQYIVWSTRSSDMENNNNKTLLPIFYSYIGPKEDFMFLFFILRRSKKPLLDLVDQPCNILLLFSSSKDMVQFYYTPCGCH